MPFAVYRFGEFSLHSGKFELCHKGRRLKLERKPLELLVLLVTRHGQIVTREEIASRLWEQEVFVDIEHGINTAIRKIRQTLDDSPDVPQFVQTISGSGYRFIATITAIEPEVTAPTQAPDIPMEPPAPPQIVVPPEIAALSEVSAAPSIQSAVNSGTNLGWSLPYAPPSSSPLRYSPSAPIRSLLAFSIETVAPRSGRLPCCLSKTFPATPPRSTSRTA